MDNRTLGKVLVGISLIILIVLIIYNIQVNSLVNELMKQSGGICITEEGKCIHEQNVWPSYIGMALFVFVLALGIYLLFFDKSQKMVEKTHENIVQRLEETKKEQLEEERFGILLKGLNEDEKRIIKIVREQDGITQATLRIRTDFSKSKLSSLLKDLEKKKLVKRVVKGKTNQVFLKEKI